MAWRRPVRIGDLLAEGGRSFSFEFFPPKDEAGEEVLWRSISELEPLQPTFVSVTYGAGGTTRDRTIAITGRIARETTLLPMAHLTCVGHTTDELTPDPRLAADSGRRATCSRCAATRSAGPGTAVGADRGRHRLRLRAGRLRPLGSATSRVGVAAFPEGHRDAASLDDDVAVLKAKHDAGAEFAVTEMVLRASDYFGLVERARAAGVDIPIIPGIMPILNINSMARMVELSGREMPDEVLARIEPLRDDPAAVRAEGIAIATELCDELLDGGAPGLHFYTLNRSKATREIYAALPAAVA